MGLFPILLRLELIRRRLGLISTTKQELWLKGFLQLLYAPSRGDVAIV
jgi:hypothetical protein